MKRFLWGASSSAFQTEGNNLASDWWHIPVGSGDGMIQEASGDADDSYHRFDEDIALLADAGLNAYRFSIEWGRIEPVRAQFSQAEIDHYLRVLDSCRHHGIEAVITLHHFTNPTWFTDQGGWLNDEAPKLFESYVRAVEPILADSAVHYVVTFNEPNQLASLIGLMDPENHEPFDPDRMPIPDRRAVSNLLAAHLRARSIIHECGDEAGWSLASPAFETPDGRPVADLSGEGKTYADRREGDFLRLSRDDDFIGVQAYTRHLVNGDGPLGIPSDARLTANGWEYYPHALATALQATAEIARIPILVTENGIATDDDDRRIDYMRDALDDAARAAESLEVPILGYLHWSLLDNYEWGSYAPHFGLVAVDRGNHFVRHPKKSLKWLGRHCLDCPSGLA
ncbi:MAG: family 1 glycosylhydrolase [Bifidobacterium sp.]|uniref:beta-glucosidase n=1 Tax=Bifidobacterium fermentum TaxID=3059035 RepID=A0AB39UAA5_9BIFI